MTLFPIVRPRLGLSITTDSICLVEIQPTLRGRSFRKLAHQTLPADLIQLSPTKPNISDPKVLSDILAALTKGYKKPQPIILSLPDVCGRTALFEFTSFPKKPADREAILSWRFQQDLNLPTKNARIGFRIYHSPKPKKFQSSQPLEVTRVLATTLPNSIIDQYELACLKAQLLPLGVGLSSLDVLDLFRSMIQETTQTASRRSQGAGNEFLFLYLAGWGFSFIALKEGMPMFVRVKSLRLIRPRISQAATGQASTTLQDPTSPSGSLHLGETVTTTSNPQPSSLGSTTESGRTRVLTNELVATLQYYLESFRSPSEKDQTLPLYFAEGIEQGSTMLPPMQEIESILKASVVNAPPINLLTFSDHLRSILPTGEKLTPHTYQKALPAYASVMVSS